jgi:HSP20 family protein
MARHKDSFEEILGLSRTMNRMLGSILLQDFGQPAPMWRPPTDVYETQDSVVVLVEIAGMDPEKIQVEFGDRILQVRGRRHDKRQRATCHCLEVQYGEFASEVYLPGQYELSAIDAEYKDGFLTITIPKLGLDERTTAVQAERGDAM